MRAFCSCEPERLLQFHDKAGVCQICHDEVEYNKQTNRFERTFIVPDRIPAEPQGDPRFNPDIHHIEARGGHYFIMEGEEKVEKIDKVLAKELEAAYGSDK